MRQQEASALAVTTSIARTVDWHEVLAVLGVPGDKVIIPGKLPCVLHGCATQMDIYADYANGDGSVWLRCAGCNFAGDILDLARRKWGLDLTTTIAKLQSCNVHIDPVRTMPENIHNHESWHTERIADIHKLWEESQQLYVREIDPGLRQLQNVLGFRPNIPRERWFSGAGLLLGGNKKKRIMQSSVARRLAMLKGLAEKNLAQLFTGNNAHMESWDNDVIILPSRDVPGRFKGFIYFGTVKRSNELLTCTAVVPYRVATAMDTKHNNVRIRADKDPGISLYDAIEHCRGDELFVMDDPTLALKLHLAHFRDNTDFLPIVSIVTASGGVMTSPIHWKNIARKLVFWGRPSSAMIMHARETDSRMSCSGFTRDDRFGKTLHRTRFMEWLPKLRRNYKSWQQVVEEQLVDLPVEKAEQLLLRLQLPEKELHDFLQRAPDLLRRRFDATLSRKVTCVTVHNTRVIECGATWTLSPSGELLSNAVLRIDKVVYYARTNKAVYVGRILFADRVIDFCELSSVVEKDAVGWLRTQLYRAGAGVLQCDITLAKVLIPTAYKFNQPEVVTGCDSVGWDMEKTCFVFPDYVLTAKGAVEPVPYTQVGHLRVPGQNAQPTEFTVDDVRAINSLNSLPTIIGAATCTLAHLLGPVFGFEPSKTAVTGIPADALRSVVTNLGGHEFVVQNTFCTEVDKLVTIGDEHKWPLLYVPPRAHPDKWRNLLVDGTLTNLITPTPTEVAAVLGLYRDWTVLHAPSPYDIITTPCLRRLIPLFLRHCLQNDSKNLSETAQNSFVMRIGAALCAWCRSTGITIQDNQVLPYLYGTDAKPEHKIGGLLDQLNKMLFEGELTIHTDGFIKKRTVIDGIIAIPSKQLMFVPKQVIDTLLHRANIPILPSAQVTDAVKAIGGDVCKYKELFGWVIPEKMWTQQHAVWRSRNPELRVIE